MALIYTKLTDKTLVLAPREGVLRKFNFGSDWTEVRVGGYFTAVSSAGSNVDVVTETLIAAGITDFPTFGIKDDSQTYPGQTGSLFLGIRTADDTECDATGTGTPVGFSSTPPHGWSAVAYHDTTLIKNGTAVVGPAFLGSASASASTAYCGFTGVKFTILNRGLSTQSVDISASFSNSVSGANYSATALRTLINNATYSTPRNVAWNDGAAARAIPDCFWVRVPFYDNALRISAIRAIRYAP